MMDALGVARDLGADDAIRVRLRCAVDAADTLGRKALDIQRANAGAIVRADAAHRVVGLGHPAMVAGSRKNDDRGVYKACMNMRKRPLFKRQGQIRRSRIG